MCHGCQAGVVSQEGEHGIDAGAGAGDGGVDAFRRDKDGAGEAVGQHSGFVGWLQAGAIRQCGEVVERGDRVHGGVLGRARAIVKPVADGGV